MYITLIKGFILRNNYVRTLLFFFFHQILRIEKRVWIISNDEDNRHFLVLNVLFQLILVLSPLIKWVSCCCPRCQNRKQTGDMRTRGVKVVNLRNKKRRTTCSIKSNVFKKNKNKTKQNKQPNQTNKQKSSKWLRTLKDPNSILQVACPFMYKRAGLGSPQSFPRLNNYWANWLTSLIIHVYNPHNRKFV